MRYHDASDWGSAIITSRIGIEFESFRKRKLTPITIMEDNVTGDYGTVYDAQLRIIKL